jgi:glycosyltransferase involved in cell wall biosynthesis
MIDHQSNGYLAQPYEIEDLARGIVWVIETESRHQNLRQMARLKVIQEFNLHLQATRYAALYAEMVERSGHRSVS